MSTNNTVNIPLFDNTTKEINPFFVANAKIRENKDSVQGKTVKTFEKFLKSFLIVIEKRELKPFIDKALRNTNISFILKKDYFPNNQKQNIFVLGESLKQYAFDNNLIYIDTAFCKGFLNITEPLEALPPEKLKHFILFALGVNSNIQSYSDDVDSIKIDHCFNVNFAQYLGQKEENQFGFVPVDLITYTVAEKERTIMSSAAGTGKSSLIMDLYRRRKNLGVNKIIVLEPTTSITGQQSKDYTAQGLNNIPIYGSAGREEQINAVDSDILICCYDSFLKINPNILEGALVVVDEYHQLVIDIDYRQKEKFRAVLFGISKAKKVLLLSATPNSFFALALSYNENFNYTLIKGIPSVQNKKEIQPLVYEGREQDIPVFVQENEPTGKGAILGKFDNKAILATVLKDANNKKYHLDILHSGDNSRKEENSNYKNILENGKFFNSKLKYLWFTTLLEAGVSIKEWVKLMVLVDVPSWQKATQLISRPRHNATSGMNAILKVWLFRSKTSEELRKKTSLQKINALDYYKENVLRAERFCHLFNIQGKVLTDAEMKESPITLSDANDHKNITYFCKEDRIYKPCLLGILRCSYEKETNVPLDLMLKRMKRFDNSVIILKTKYINTSRNPEFEEIKANQKVEKEEANSKFKELLISDFSKVVEVICQLSKNPDRKAEIRAVLNITPINKGEVLDFMKESKGAFSTKESSRIINDIVDIVSSDKRLSKLKIIKFVTDSDKKIISDYKSQLGRNKRKHLALFNESSLSAPATKAYHREQAICKAIEIIRSNVSKGNRNEWIKIDTLTKLINKAVSEMKYNTGKVYKSINKKKALIILKDIYDISSKQTQKNRKRVWLYKIGLKKTITELQKIAEI